MRISDWSSDVCSSDLFSGWNLTLDYIYSHMRNPFTIVDLSQTVNPALGLNGFTIDGRPIYRAIDPTVANCNAELVDLNPGPVYQNVTSRSEERSVGKECVSTLSSQWSP